MRVWNFASHHITLWFSFYVDVGIHLRGTYIIHHIPHMDMRWNWIGIDIPTVCSGTSYHAILYHHVSFLSSPSFLVSLSFCSLCWNEARLFPLGTLPLLMYHLLLLFLLCFFHNSHAGYRPALFIIFFCLFWHSYIHPTCVLGRGTLYTACAVILSWSCLYTLTGWVHNEDIAFHCPCSVHVTVVNHNWLFFPASFFANLL